LRWSRQRKERKSDKEGTRSLRVVFPQTSGIAICGLGGVALPKKASHFIGGKRAVEAADKTSQQTTFEHARQAVHLAIWLRAIAVPVAHALAAKARD